MPGVNALFCRAEARGFQKKGLTLGQPSRMRGRERRLSALEPRKPGAWMERWPSLPAHLTESWGVAGFDPALEFLHFSGGSGAGSYTDPTGPDASREMIRFFFAQPASAG